MMANDLPRDQWKLVEVRRLHRNVALGPGVPWREDRIMGIAEAGGEQANHLHADSQFSSIKRTVIAILHAARVPREKHPTGFCTKVSLCGERIQPPFE